MLPESREIKETRGASEFQPEREVLVTAICQSCGSAFDATVSTSTAIAGWVLPYQVCGERQAVIKQVFGQI